MLNSDALRKLYREMPIVELNLFERSYCAEDYEPEAQEVIAAVLAERRQEIGPLLFSLSFLLSFLIPGTHDIIDER